MSLRILLLAEDVSSAEKGLKEIAANVDLESSIPEQIKLKDGTKIFATTINSQLNGHQFDQLFLCGIKKNDTRIYNVFETLRDSCVPEEFQIQEIYSAS